MIHGPHSYCLVLYVLLHKIMLIDCQISSLSHTTDIQSLLKMKKKYHIKCLSLFVFLHYERFSFLSTCTPTNDGNNAFHRVACGTSPLLQADKHLLLYTHQLLWWLEITDALTLWTKGFQLPHGSFSNRFDEAIPTLALSPPLSASRVFAWRGQKKTNWWQICPGVVIVKPYSMM